VDVGPAELLIVLVVVLLLFGSKKLPDLARGMGQAASEFRKGLHFGGDDPEESTSTTADDTTTPSKPTDPPA
jgi:sec-independent protein translocase protein TatA